MIEETRVKKIKTIAYMSWTDDGSIPVAHEDVVSIFETVRARAITDALLALLEFFEQAEVAWY